VSYDNCVNLLVKITETEIKVNVSKTCVV
jgi:hypothetical protein